MARSLRDKLNAIQSASSAPPAHEGGLLTRIFETHPPAALQSLTPTALRRLGLTTPLNLSKTAFLDTETTGLAGAGTVAFLVGLGFVSNDQLTVRQYLMRGYADEPALLDAITAQLRGIEALVTFNGKSFDVPLLEGRYTMCRMESPLKNMNHLDLLHPARRVWKLRLEKCNLTRIEEEILGFHREHDLPGAEVPERFFQFLKCGDMALLEDVIDHNRLDILTLFTLLGRLSAVYESPAQQMDMLDLFSMGRVMEKQGELSEAQRCYRLASKPPVATSLQAISSRAYAAQAGYNLSRIAKRAGDIDEAERLLQDLARRGQMGALPLIELSKLAEHRRKSPRRALEYAQAALALAADEDEKAQITHRMNRLKNKLSKERIDNGSIFKTKK